MTYEKSLTLSNGVKIPSLGFGTWCISDNDSKQFVFRLHSLNVKKRTMGSTIVPFGGRYRTRTCDFLHVKETLSQLS